MVISPRKNKKNPQSIYHYTLIQMSFMLKSSLKDVVPTKQLINSNGNVNGYIPSIIFEQNSG